MREQLQHYFERDGVPSALDVKLGGRMLLKHLGLALVGGIGMAVATAIGAGSFAFFNTYAYCPLPLHEGERVVSIINWDSRRGNDNPARPARVRDCGATEAKSLVTSAAYRTSRRNLIDNAGEGSPVSVAEMSAAGFRVARISPAHGRLLVDADEGPGAPSVIVISHHAWTMRFEGDQGIIGRTIRLRSHDAHGCESSRPRRSGRSSDPWCRSNG